MTSISASARLHQHVALRSFNTSNVPSFKDFEPFHMKQREDWPMFHWKFIDTISLTYSFVVVNVSDISRKQHTTDLGIEGFHLKKQQV